MPIVPKSGRIRALRIDNGFTQIEMSRILGIASAYLSQIERGCRTPGRKLLAKLEKFAAERGYPLYEQIDEDTKEIKAAIPKILEKLQELDGLKGLETLSNQIENLEIRLKELETRLR